MKTSSLLVRETGMLRSLKREREERREGKAEQTIVMTYG